MQHGTRRREDAKTRRFDDCSDAVIGACIEVHRVLGPGLLESAYEHCLAHELLLRGLTFDRQRPLPVDYKGMRIELAYRLDFVINGELILEVKAVDRLLSVHEAQVVTHLKLSQLPIGLLVNFQSPIIKAGLRRFVLTPKQPSRLRDSV